MLLVVNTGTGSYRPVQDPNDFKSRIRILMYKKINACILNGADGRNVNS
jgi:hypothetical protein